MRAHKGKAIIVIRAFASNCQCLFDLNVVLNVLIFEMNTK